MAMAHDVPVPGYRNETVNTLRLWAAESSHGFNLEYFNRGDYIAAVEEKSRSKSISRILYPNDNVFSGKKLRLKQEYFFVAASLQDIVRRYKKTRTSFNEFAQKVAIQLNDTHPALAIPELMRILVDREQLSWDEAWEITVETFGYTNHTLLPEALEEWPIGLFSEVLPRHTQIIFEINDRFLQSVRRRHPGDNDRLRRMSLVAEDGDRRIRMSHLAIVGSHAVNGVSELHSQLLRTRMFRDFDEFYPWRFCTTTNGITPRRWLKMANPALAACITKLIGDDWIRDLTRLEALQEHLSNPELVAQWAEVKQQNKARLAETIRAELNISVDLNSMFDCQVKRIHEYKRQLLNLLHVINTYNQIRDGVLETPVPRTVLFAGKAAPGYATAKMIIRLINGVADVVNHDPRVKDVLRVVFLPNYNVSLAEQIMPAMELSEQISTAGTEASGTGNMKAMLNGALTIGTWDGANIEIEDAVGDDNIFIFGKTAEQVDATFAGGYDPRRALQDDSRLRRAIEMIADGFFSTGDASAFRPLLEGLFQSNDRFLVLDEFADYIACQEQVSQAYGDQQSWTRKSIINTAKSGRFSSDNTVLTYARKIWGLDV